MTITRSSVLRAFLGEHTNSSVTVGCTGRKGGEVLHGLVREALFLFFVVVFVLFSFFLFKAEVDQKTICCLLVVHVLPSFRPLHLTWLAMDSS